MNRRKTSINYLFILSVLLCTACTKSNMTLDKWVAEDHSKAVSLELKQDIIEIISPDGLTLWYDQYLEGSYKISYDIMMVMEGGKYDRLSDMNCFWAAKDPKFPQNIYERAEWRDGVFKNYNTLELFYVGYGGNYNTTTRFREYYGGDFSMDSPKVKPLVKEYNDTENLLKPNKWYRVELVVKGGITTYSINGKQLFERTLDHNNGEGYFGLRLLENHILFTNFEVEQL